MNAGGAETFLMKLYRCLDKSEYQMDFAVGAVGEGFYDEEIQKSGGKIYHITPKSAGALKNFKDIKRVVKENGYKYVLRISQHSLSALELLAARLGGAKVTAFRSSNSDTTTGRKKDVFLHKMCRFMPKKFADVRIAPSTEAAEFMFGKDCIKNGKAVILHNAVDLNTYNYNEVSREKIRKEFGLSEKTVIGHIGRFNRQKNHSFLLEIFAEFLKLKPDSVLMLVGGGELEEQIKSKAEKLGIADKIIFTGVRDDVPSLLSAMDAFVFPSFYEGMPNTVIEAQAAGLPCVISDRITREADITGLVKFLPLESPEKWAEETLRVITAERETPVDSFKENKYDIESVVGQFTNLIFADGVKLC